MLAEQSDFSKAAPLTRNFETVTLPLSQTDSESCFRTTLALETLRSEQRRLRLILGFLAAAFGAFVVLSLVPGVMTDMTMKAFRGQAPYVAILFGVAMVYEGAVLVWVGRLLRDGQIPGIWPRLIHVLIETSLPTATLIIASTVFGPLEALVAAPSRFYYLFIIMSALQLDYRLCVFSGAVAAVQYASIAGVLLPRGSMTSSAPLLADPGHHLALAGLLFMAGIIAAFVAAQIRGQLESALRSSEERNRTISLFGQYVSSQVVDKVLRQPAGFRGEVRRVSVMFVDIRNFSEFANHRESEEVMTYLNSLFGPMVDVIHRHHGIVNKFLGDGFMAIFGAPLDDTRHGRHAVQAGFDLIAEIRRLSETGAVHPTRIGIGIHEGEVMAGTVGSMQRKEYTIIGDVVNVAARIEAANKRFQTQMLVSENVKVLLEGSVPDEDLGLVDLKGQQAPIRLYRLA